jgi:methionyl-tRNA formyltransferase
MSTPSVITWGRGAALVALTDSMVAAGLSVQEIWCVESPDALDLFLTRASAKTQEVPCRGGIRDTDVILERLRELGEVALIAEVFFPARISSRILDRKPVVNVHPSPLPKYRGAHPLPWQILRGETVSAVTFHLVTSDIDAGPILGMVPFDIAPSDMYGDILDRVVSIIRREAGAVIRDYLCGQIVPREQDHTAATFVVRRSREDGAIDWCDAAEAIRNKVRALAEPLPGAWTHWNGRCVIVDDASVDLRFAAYVGRTCGKAALLGGVLGILTADAAIVPRRVRDAETGRDVTAEIRVNDRFS